MKPAGIVIMFVSAAVLFDGCRKYDDTDVVNRIVDLEKRVATLEEVAAELQERIEAGALIESMTAIEEPPGGWRIEFTGGDPSYIDLFNGEDSAGNPNPVTPLFEVRDSEIVGGTLTLWVDYGNGWEDTGAVISDPETLPEPISGQQGEQGETGAQGPQGISPLIQVRRNVDDTVTVWYNITHTNGAGGTWVDTGYDISKTGPVLSIVRGEGGTVTITMNDADPTAEPAKPATTFTFREATDVVLPVRIEVRATGVVGMLEGETAEVEFVVNPSDATIATGDMTLWAIDRIATRAGYVVADDVFSVTAIAGGNGKYTATILAGSDVAESNDEHTVALVYNAGTAEAPSLISSGMFGLRVDKAVQELNHRVTWDGETGSYTITTDPTDAGLYFKFGSVAGLFSGNGANQTLPAINTDAFDAGDVAWSPVEVTNWTSVPVYSGVDAPVEVTPEAGYHTVANVKAGKGDPCRLVGLDLAKIKDTDEGSLTPADIDNGKWRLPTVDENNIFAGCSTMNNTDAHWTTIQSGVTGGMFPDAISGSVATFLPAAGYRNHLGGEVREQGQTGYYTTTSEDYRLVFLSGLVVPKDVVMYNIGHSIRCVRQ